MAVKIKWFVDEAPTGPYRSFRRRNWPTGYINGEYVVKIWCSDEYVPARVRAGDHGPITVVFTDLRDKVVGWDLRRLKTEFKTLAEAKLAAQLIFDRHPEYLVNKIAET